MKNRFGKRFISDREFLEYGTDIGIFTDHPHRGLLEFLERLEILTPVARVRFPDEIVRRWFRDRHPKENVSGPVEGNTTRLAAANSLDSEIFYNRWSNPDVFGERIHALDEIASAHEPFVQTVFESATFVPWDDFATPVIVRDGAAINDGGMKTRTCYHYWQIFPLASYLRSGATLLYDLDNEAVRRDVHELTLSETSRNSIYMSINLEARHDIRRIMERQNLFNAVAHFEAYRQNALQLHVHNWNPQTHRLPLHLSRQYQRRSRAIAAEVLVRYSIRARDVLEFIKFQCDLWCTAKERSPAKVAEEYRRNIEASVALYRRVSRSNSDKVITAVGQAGGYFEPILKVIFPSWLDEQRDLAERSLRSWILPSMSGLPAPFTVAEPDIGAFCAWIERQGLYQLYWHFKRLLDLGFGDAPVALAATAAEAVSYANTIELLANAILEERGQPARGRTLAIKVREIVHTSSPALIHLLVKFKGLTKTDNSTLKRRLAQIDRIRRGGTLAPIARILLKLIVIRNEGSHLGLGGFDRRAIYGLLEALVQAGLLVWKAR